MSNERSERGVPVFVMLPLDTVDPSSRQLKRRSTLRLQLEKLREAGVEGVMVDVWWGLVERKPREYEWGAYMQLVQLLEELQLKAQCVMSFHACGGNVGDDCNIPLPPWVARSAAIAASANDDEAHALPFYKDRDGHVSYEYVSCAANEQPVLSGRSPRECYSDLMHAFADQFRAFLGSTIVEIQVGLGPCGELRYPSYPQSRWRFPGVGAFQCYDKYMLQSLADAARVQQAPAGCGQPPDGTGSYNDAPDRASFFAGKDGAWSSEAGRFFLRWYASCLVQHADGVLADAKDAFRGEEPGVALAAKVAGIHWLYRTPSRGAEATAGYSHEVPLDDPLQGSHTEVLLTGSAAEVVPRMPAPADAALTEALAERAEHDDASARGFALQASRYAPLALVLARHGVVCDFTCLEMRDRGQPRAAHSSPESLVREVRHVMQRMGVQVAGENALQQFSASAFGRVLQHAWDPAFPPLRSFTLLRLCPQLVAGDAWALFRGFVRLMREGAPRGYRGEDPTAMLQRLTGTSEKRGEKGGGNRVSHERAGAKDAGMPDLLSPKVLGVAAVAAAALVGGAVLMYMRRPAGRR